MIFTKSVENGETDASFHPIQEDSVCSFRVILLNCAFIQGLGQPPTLTPTATATNTPIPIETETRMEPVFPTEDDLVDTRWTLMYDAPQDGHREYDIIFPAGGRL
jgi:hypothetical protein